jgi:hypothetical protein
VLDRNAARASPARAAFLAAVLALCGKRMDGIARRGVEADAGTLAR